MQGSRRSARTIRSIRSGARFIGLPRSHHLGEGCIFAGRILGLALEGYRLTLEPDLTYVNARQKGLFWPWTWKFFQ